MGTPENHYCNQCGEPNALGPLFATTSPRSPLHGVTIESLWATGGSSLVYQARRGDQTLALKVLKRDHRDQPELRARFRFEEDVYRHVQMPGTAHFHGAGELRDGSPFLMLEFVHGQTLAAAMGCQRRCTLPVAIELSVRLCRLLHRLHLHGIIHRDVKPSNVMLSGPHAEHMTLLDFGSACPRHGLTRLTQEGMTIGTPAYMAPEQAMGERVDARADLYAVGVILHLALSGTLPFEAPSGFELACMKVMTNPRSLRERFAHLPIPPTLDDTLMRMLARRPEDRFDSALEAEVALLASTKS